MSQNSRRESSPRLVTAEMLAPHVVGEPLVLHSTRRSGVLVAADAGGGVISLRDGAVTPERHEILSG